MFYFSMETLRLKQGPAKRKRDHREYQRLYRERNREKLAAYLRQRRTEQRDYLRIRWWFRRRFNRIMDREGEHQQDRKYSLKKKYGLTEGDYYALFAAQDAVCAICRCPETRTNRTRYLCVDHCHETGKIRGLLCHDCNTALGAVHDNPDTLRAMIAYLGRF